MKILCPVLGFLCLLSQFAFGASEANYFNGSQFEVPRSVRMIGVPMSSGDVERENQIAGSIESNRGKLSACYERELNNGPLANVDAIFYFSVGADGKFSNVTADVMNSSDLVAPSQRLTNCVSQTLDLVKAPVYVASRIFRFRVLFFQP